MRTDLSPSSCRQTLFAAVLAVLWLAANPGEAAAQGVDTARTITIPAPERGIIYIRSGPPGAVRIRSRHTTRRTAESPRMQAEIQPGVSGASEPFRAADLTRLEALLARQGFDLDLGLARRGGEDVVVLRRRGSGSAEAADTLSPAAAMNLLETLGGRATPDEAPRADLPPLATRIERSLLEEGLFRSVQVNFEFDRSELLPTANATLDAVADVLARFPDLRIEVAGHTDSVGPDVYNRQLSNARAERVRLSLLERGVRPDRVRSQGYGEKRPILSNDNPTGRALNRRVEFVLLSPEASEPADSEPRQTGEEQLERLERSIQEGIRDGFEDTKKENDE